VRTDDYHAIDKLLLLNADCGHIFGFKNPSGGSSESAQLQCRGKMSQA
jgi:hypothetical protein